VVVPQGQEAIPRRPRGGASRTDVIPRRPHFITHVWMSVVYA